MPETSGRPVFGDVRGLEPQLATLRSGKGFLEADLAVADRLDLAAG
jgi:hypothetical protein